MHDATKTAITARLRRIEGQVGGLIRMVDEDRYCVDVLIQINAVRAALHKVEEQIYAITCRTASPAPSHPATLSNRGIRSRSW